MIRRAKVEPRDVSAENAARRLGLSLPQFETCKYALFDRGFPEPDPTTGMFDLDAIDQWRKLRNPALFGLEPLVKSRDLRLKDAREKLKR